MILLLVVSTLFAIIYFFFPLFLSSSPLSELMTLTTVQLNLIPITVMQYAVLQSASDPKQNAPDPRTLQFKKSLKKRGQV